MRRVLLLAVGLLLLAAAPSATADTVARQGWWTALNPGGLPPSVTGPDVPADGFLVQGGASDASPTAVAALVVPVPDGAAVRTLVVHAAPGAGNVSGSVIKACRLTTSDFEPAQGGPMSAAPGYDCSDQAAVPAGADGITYAFDARTLVSNGIVAVALVPGSTVTRVAFSKPDQDVLLYASAAPTSGGAVSGPAAGGSTTPAAPSAPSFSSAATALTTPPAAAASTGTIAAAPKRATATAASTGGAPTASPLALALLVAAVGGAGAAWAKADRNKPQLAPAATAS